MNNPSDTTILQTGNIYEPSFKKTDQRCAYCSSDNILTMTKSNGWFRKPSYSHRCMSCYTYFKGSGLKGSSESGFSGLNVIKKIGLVISLIAMIVFGLFIVANFQNPAEETDFANISDNSSVVSEIEEQSVSTVQNENISLESIDVPVLENAIDEIDETLISEQLDGLLSEQSVTNSGLRTENLPRIEINPELAQIASLDSTEASGESFDAAPDVTNQEQVEVVDLFDEINIVEESSGLSNQELPEQLIAADELVTNEVEANTETDEQVLSNLEESILKDDVVINSDSQENQANARIGDLFSVGENKYTIQIASKESLLETEQFIESLSPNMTEPFFYYLSKNQSQDWYPVLYGVFDTIEETNIAITQLPQNILNNRPIPRSIETVLKKANQDY